MSQQINLYNSQLSSKRQAFSALMMVEILGALLVVLASYALFSNWQLSQLKAQQAATSNRLAAKQSEVTAVKAALAGRQPSKRLEIDIASAENEIASLQRVFDLLEHGEFGNTRGYSAYLRAFARQIVDGVWLTGFAIQGAGNEIGLNGRALQPSLVPTYINQLRNEDVLHGASFATLEMKVPMLEAKLEPGTPAKPPTPAPFIEFSLQSSAVKAQAAGGKTK